MTGLDQLLPLLELMIEFYDVQKVCNSEEGKTEVVLVAEDDGILKEDLLLETCEAVRFRRLCFNERLTV